MQVDTRTTTGIGPRLKVQQQLDDQFALVDENAEKEKQLRILIAKLKKAAKNDKQNIRRLKKRLAKAEGKLKMSQAAKELEALNKQIEALDIKYTALLKRHATLENELENQEVELDHLQTAELLSRRNALEEEADPEYVPDRLVQSFANAGAEEEKKIHGVVKVHALRLLATGMGSEHAVSALRGTQVECRDKQEWARLPCARTLRRWRGELIVVARMKVLDQLSEAKASVVAFDGSGLPTVKAAAPNFQAFEVETKDGKGGEIKQGLGLSLFSLEAQIY